MNGGTTGAISQKCGNWPGKNTRKCRNTARPPGSLSGTGVPSWQQLSGNGAGIRFMQDCHFPFTHKSLHEQAYISVPVFRLYCKNTICKSLYDSMMTRNNSPA